MDHFGNLVRNLRVAYLHAWSPGGSFRLQVGPLTANRLARTYADAAAGEFLALGGSHGLLEIACALDSAARRLHGGVGLSLAIFQERPDLGG